MASADSSLVLTREVSPGKVHGLSARAVRLYPMRLSVTVGFRVFSHAHRPHRGLTACLCSYGRAFATDFFRAENLTVPALSFTTVVVTISGHFFFIRLVHAHAGHTRVGVPPTRPMSCQYSAECLISFAHHGPGGQSPPPLEWAQLSCGNLRLSFKIQNRPPGGLVGAARPSRPSCGCHSFFLVGFFL